MTCIRIRKYLKDLLRLLRLKLFFFSSPIVVYFKSLIYQSISRMHVITSNARSQYAYLGIFWSFLSHETRSRIQYTTQYDVVRSVCHGCRMHAADSETGNFLGFVNFQLIKYSWRQNLFYSGIRMIKAAWFRTSWSRVRSQLKAFRSENRQSNESARCQGVVSQETIDWFV